MTPPRPPPPAMRDALVSWFASHGRDYPWRRTREPYAVLVSEMMLQQTQVKTVLERGYYARWMEKFPDVRTLAAAREDEVLRVWEGLGYYARARNLHKAARAVAATHDGVFPVTVEALESLPGIGPYTARAVAAFALDHPVPVLDANVIRVLARLVNFREPVDSGTGPKVLFNLAAAMVPAAGGRDFNSAMMELGQRVCLPRRPDCEACPVARWCRARAHNPGMLPVKRPRRETVFVEEHAIIARKDGKILLQRESGRRRMGCGNCPAARRTKHARGRTCWTPATASRTTACVSGFSRLRRIPQRATARPGMMPQHSPPSRCPRRTARRSPG